jgi:hypothetical protein
MYTNRMLAKGLVRTQDRQTQDRRTQDRQTQNAQTQNRLPTACFPHIKENNCQKINTEEKTRNTIEMVLIDRCFIEHQNRYAATPSIRIFKQVRRIAFLNGSGNFDRYSCRFSRNGFDSSKVNIHKAISKHGGNNKSSPRQKSHILF